LLNTTVNIPANILRSVLAPYVPNGVALTAQDIVNFLLWAKRNGNKLDQAGSKVIFRKSKLGWILAGKNTEDNMHDAPATFEASEILCDVLVGLFKEGNG
jgi:hypothetical protein